MKLRIRGDSLRFRLTATEVTSLNTQGWWQDAATLGPQAGPRLIYRVETEAMDKPAVRFASGLDTTVTVVLPAVEVAHWAGNGSQVGLYFEESWGLKVAIEKDFRCLDPNRDEDESDNFDNPNAGTSQHGECQPE